MIPEQCEFQSDVNKLEQKKTFDKSLVEWPRSSFTCWTAHVQDLRIYKMDFEYNYKVIKSLTGPNVDISQTKYLVISWAN